MTGRTRIDWRVIDPLLGKLSDPWIARQFGISHSSVRSRRRSRGIAPIPNDYDARLARLRTLLGTAPVADLSSRTGLSKESVYNAHHRAGVAVMRVSERPLPPKLLARYRGGKIARRDFVLACREAGCTLAAVGRELGVTRERVRQIALPVDPRVRARGRPRAFPEEFDKLLGTVPDREIAEMAHCCLQTVFAQRRALGIRPVNLRALRERRRSFGPNASGEPRTKDSRRCANAPAGRR